MEIYRSLDEIARPFHRPAVTIGNFDGVHLGHQSLFCKVVELASKREGDTVAITFEPHPLAVLRPQDPPKMICTFHHKAELISRSGIEHLVSIPFTRELASTPARVFVEEVLVKRIGVEDLVVGYDYAFGRGREGDTRFLAAVGEELGFRVHVMPPYRVGGEVVSSTRIRELVSQGKMRRVAAMLGRFYQIRGVVQEGKRRGGPLVGFPTANLHFDRHDLCPKEGVYVVQVIHDLCCYGGVVNIGTNPTFGDTGLVAEVHIFDFDKTIYGHQIKVNFIERLRDEIRFPSVEALSAQIALDVAQAREIIARESGLTRACLEG